LCNDQKYFPLLRVVVLLKNGELEAVECQDQDLFLVARVRGAGICGTFDDRASANAFIAKVHTQQQSIPGWQSAQEQQ
jgi:hypothetical protein